MLSDYTILREQDIMMYHKANKLSFLQIFQNWCSLFTFPSQECKQTKKTEHLARYFCDLSTRKADLDHQVTV